MKISLTELRSMVGTIIAEEKKKAKGKKAEKLPQVLPREYSTDKALNFAPPLGDLNTYKIQGAAGFGPLTAAISPRDCGEVEDLEEKVLRSFVRKTIGEMVSPQASAWRLLEKRQAPTNIWEAAAYHWYDHEKRGLGKDKDEPKKGKKK